MSIIRIQTIHTTTDHYMHLMSQNAHMIGIQSITYLRMATINDDPSQVESIFNRIRANHRDRPSDDIAFRKRALQALSRGYEAMKDQISEALKNDLGLNTFMADFGAHSITLNQIKHLIKGIDSWRKPKSIPTPIGMGMGSCNITPQPLGVVLVLSAWNYPIYTAIPQVAAAISAGNSVILKPSELAPHTSNALKRLFEKHMDPNYFIVVEGKVEVAKAITRLPFDMICFTGSTQTGRLVAIEAAKNLTPCLLELGGKCPVIIDQTAKLESAAMRVLFGKYFNCGQTCIGVDHVYVHDSIKDRFTELLLKTAENFYGNGQNLMDEGNYGKIVNSFHVNRIQNYLKDNHEGKVIYGGKIQKDQRYISPTIIQSPRKDSLMMKDEIFGPILPLFTYTDLKQTVKEINSRPKPLVVYLFSESSKNIDYVNKHTSSGTFTVNDTIVQMLNADLPFGGVGGSGYGRFHGQSGFIAFSNCKSVAKTAARNNFPLSQRFPPYTDSRKKTMTFLLKFGGITYGQILRVVLALIVLIAIIATLTVVLPRVTHT